MTILSPIKHIVVVMFENRSLDHMLGGLYPSGSAPSAVLPPGGASTFNGLSAGLSNPANAAHFMGGASALVPVTTSVASSTVPDPGPEETFTNVTYQLYDLQRSLVSGAARRYGLDPAAALAQIHSRQHAVDFFKRRSSRALL